MDSKHTIKQEYSIYKVVAVSTLIGVLTVMIFLPLAAVLITALNLKVSSAGPLSSLCVGAGGFVSGFFAARKKGNKGIIIGAVCGIVMFVLLKLVALLINPNGFTVITLIHFAIIVICSSIGGIIGVNKSNKRKIV